MNKEMPNNIPMEQELLGALMYNTDAALLLSADLKAEHFYEGVHQRIFERIVELRREGKSHNPVSLKSICAPEYLVSMVSLASRLTPVSEYSDTIIDLAMQRLMLKVALEVIESGYSGMSSADMTCMLAKAVNEVNVAATTKLMRASPKTSVSIIESHRELTSRVSTGIARFDKALCGGFKKGEAYAIAARPGYGKTMIAGTISHNMNYAGDKHLFICAEMGDEEIHSRSLARSMRCENSALPHMLTEAANVAREDPGNVIYQSDPFLTFDALKRYVSNAIAKYQVEGFILDYFQLVRGMEKGGNLVMHLENVAQWIAATCKANNIWALVLAQLNKEGSTRWGDAMEMAFTNLFYLHRVDIAGEPSKYSPLAWLQMDKCRGTEFMDVGSAKNPALEINPNGPYFEERNIAEEAPLFSYGSRS